MHQPDKHNAKHQAAAPAAAATAQLAKMPLPELFTKLDAGEQGLSSRAAEQRLVQYGYNEITEKQVNPLLQFLSYFWGPIPGMIMVAAVLSGVLKHWSDLGIILALLILNAVIGFREEHQAGNAVRALKEKLATQAKVKREGKWLSIAARELVPGDVIRLHIGDIIPADARLMGEAPVEIDQSALTGESLPVERQQGEVVYSGSILRQGETEAIVFATGAVTFYGRTAELVKGAQSRSHLQKAVMKIADYLIALAVALAVCIFAVALFRGDKLLEVLQFALVLTIAAVPVAMPAVLSVTMAVGSRLLAVKQAIVTRLTSIEELAGVDVLCSDKTGTLTQNALTMGDPFVIGGSNADEIIFNAALASRAENQDPIDLAILAGVKDQQHLAAIKVVHFQPFDPVSKRAEAEVSDDGHHWKVAKGAPQVIFALDPDAAKIEAEFNQAIAGFAAKGFRALGVARTDKSGKWHLLGLIPLYDPLRADSRDTVNTARDMGIEVKMVTGDQVAIASEIGRQLDLGDKVMDAAIFSQDPPVSDADLLAAVNQSNGFAQVFPEHKHRIVKILQGQGHIVGMTGDGVNDAPALKKADVGIAVSGATDAARAAAAIVLLAPGLSVVIDAIKESRKIFQRMTNYAIYRIAETIRVLIFMTLAILVFNFYPVTAVMIVLLAILNDGAILSIAYDNARYDNQPETWNMRLVLGVATAIGLMGVVESFGLFYLAQQVFHLSRDMIQTLIYLKLSVAGHLTVFVARTRGPFWSVKPSRILLGAVVLTQLAATLIAVYGLVMSPIGWHWAGVVWGYALAWFLIEDRIKLFAYRLLDREPSGYFGRMCRER